MTAKRELRRREGTLYPAEVKREVDRLRAVDAELEAAMQGLDRFDRDDVELSVTQAKAAVADARKWVDDAIVCLKVDHGIPVDDDEDDS